MPFVVDGNTIQLSHHSAKLNYFCRYRWYILTLYSVIAAMSNISWNTWGPIETTARAVFGWDAGTISLLSDWGAITFVLFVFPSSYVLDKFGESIIFL